MVKMATELLVDADVGLLCNAGYQVRSEDRVNSRNAHRPRRWDTRAGTITLERPAPEVSRCRLRASTGGRPPGQGLPSLVRLGGYRKGWNSIHYNSDAMERSDK